MTGWAAPSSDWNGRQWGSNYAIAFLRIDGYIKEKLAHFYNINMSSNSSSSLSTSLPRHHHQRKLRRAKNSHSNQHQQHEFQNSNRLAYILHTASPSTSPIRQPPLPWVPHWQWLNGYSGGNGPIVKLVPGSDHLRGCLFIVGAFNNNQAVVIWCNSTIAGPTVTGISPNHTILGLITSIVQLSSSDDDINPSSGPVGPPSPEVVIIDRGHAVLLLASFAILLAAVIGLVIFRQRQGYSPVSGLDDETVAGRDKTKASAGLTFPLTTLSGGMDHSVDFRASFERAMHARHLPSHESLLIIDPSEVILSKAIGEGSFGRVWSGYWRNNAVAIKEFIFAQSAIVGGSVDRNNIIDEIVGEAGIMACLRHPKILQIYGCSLTMQAIWIASELCNRGSLRMVLNDKTVDLTWLKKLSLCVDVADGMLYLHTRNPPIIHRDLKSHNIFIIETTPGHLIAKIGDWGSARALALSGAKSMTQGVGTACWLAPEVINNAHFSKDSDVYAFGILLWEVYTRLEVHDRLSAAQIIAKVAHEGLRPPVPRNCPWADLMTSCWEQNNRMRPGFNKILTELSAMYSSAKANLRLQQLVETNKLKVNPPAEMTASAATQPQDDAAAMAAAATRPHRVRSSPGLLVPSASNAVIDTEEQDVFEAESRIRMEATARHANSTPLPVQTSAMTSFPYPATPTTNPPSPAKAHALAADVDMLLMANDVVTYAEQPTFEQTTSSKLMLAAAQPESDSGSPMISLPEETVTEQSRNQRTPRKNVPYFSTSSPNRYEADTGSVDERHEISPDAGGYDTT
jgi:serine/threonine protein kinase